MNVWLHRQKWPEFEGEYFLKKMCVTKQGSICVSKIMKNKSRSSIFEVSIFKHLHRDKDKHFPICVLLDLKIPLSESPHTSYWGFPRFSCLKLRSIFFLKSPVAVARMRSSRVYVGNRKRTNQGPRRRCWRLPYFSEWHWLDLTRLTSLNARGSERPVYFG